MKTQPGIDGTGTRPMVADRSWGRPTSSVQAVPRCC